MNVREIYFSRLATYLLLLIITHVNRTEPNHRSHYHHQQQQQLHHTMDTIDYRRLSAQDKQMLGSPHSTPVKQVSVTENSKKKKRD